MLPVPPGVKLRRTWPQRLLLGLNVLVVLAAFGAGAGLLYVDDKTTSIQHVQLSHVLSGTDDGDITAAPINVLLVGVDDAEGQIGRAHV